MPLTVAFPDRKRRQFTLPPTASLLDLVRLIHADFSMDDFRLFFQGREIADELQTLAHCCIPENALLRVDDLETPRAHTIVDVDVGVPEVAEVPPASSLVESEVSRVLGFSNFSSSKNKSHKASDASGYRKTSRAVFRTFRVLQPGGRGIRAVNNR